jgi:hypothetical protein
VVGADDGQSIGALEQGEGLADGFDEAVPVVLVLGEVLGDELGDDLGVGVGVEGDAFFLQLALEAGVVLDDAVVDDGDGAAAVEVGWALTSLAGPWVAQRVWLMPVRPGAGRSLRWWMRSCSRPARLRRWSLPFFCVARPELS